MSKTLSLKDFILLSAGIANDILGEFKSVSGVVPYLQGYRYGSFPVIYKKNSYIQSISKMVAEGEIKKNIDKKGKITLSLTAKGKTKIINKFPLLTNYEWDGSFMIVVFDVPEKRRIIRDVLRVKLKEMGFGKLQESVWISPYHFEDVLKNYLDSSNFTDFVFVMKASRVLGKDLKQNAQNIWKLNILNIKYENLLKDLSIFPKHPNLNDKKKLWNEYIKIISEDPLLPKELLPADWHAEKVRVSLDKILTTVHK